MCAAVALAFSACSLDRTPSDPNTNTEFNQDAVFTKIYATFATTGQKGPDGDGDVDGIDEGTSAFYRMIWELNEFPTDEGWWIWNDVGLADTRTMVWTKSNTLAAGVYYRLYFDITLCNLFLTNTEGQTDEKSVAQRAEVRMIRAINYYYLLDMFGKVPFVVTNKEPEFEDYTDADNHALPIERKDLFRWLERECTQLADVLPAAGNRHGIYQLDQAAAWFILMRLYLNAEVYTASKPGAADGQEHWSDAAEFASRLIRSPYQLLKGDKAAVEGDKVTYSAYQKLFMGDNDTNGAQNEAIFLIYQDANYCQSWGGSRFLVNTFRDANFVPSGSTDSWSCFRSSPEFVYYWVDKATAASIKVDEYHMPIVLGDDRAILCSGSDSTAMTKTWSLKGNEEADIYASWALLKWTGIYSTSESPNSWTSPIGEPNWVDTDIPFFRLAEAYLSYAEAVYRGGQQADMTALEAVNVLRDRAHATPLTELSDEVLLKEWAKEFYCEGRRRTDLIRFGEFAGPATTMSWEGHKAASKDARYCVYPIPEADEIANPNMTGVNAEIGY